MRSTLQLLISLVCAVLASEAASAVPIGTYSLTINALDSVSGAVIDSSSTGVTPLVRGWHRTPESVRLDTPPPGFKLYFATATIREPGDNTIGVGANVVCSSGDYCGDEVPSPDLVRIDLEVSESYLINQPQRFYEFALTNATGTISSLDPGGDVLFLESDSVTRIDQDVINSLSPGACASGACEFRFDITGDGSVNSGMQVAFAPEPGTAFLLGLGLSGLACRRRSEHSARSS